jgi:hypothetical protein
VENCTRPGPSRVRTPPPVSKNSSLLRDLLLSKRPPPPQMVIHSNIVSKRLRQEIIEIPDTRND